MTEFRVHFIKTDGDKTTHVVNAESPAQAAAIIRKKNPGVTVIKVKVNKAGNASQRINGRSGTIIMNELESLVARGELAEYKIFRNNHVSGPDIIGTVNNETIEINVMDEEFTHVVTTRRG